MRNIFCLVFVKQEEKNTFSIWQHDQAFWRASLSDPCILILQWKIKIKKELLKHFYNQSWAVHECVTAVPKKNQKTKNPNCTMGKLFTVKSSLSVSLNDSSRVLSHSK